jgi:hypothetical protein
MSIPDLSKHGIKLQPVRDNPGWYASPHIEHQEGKALSAKVRGTSALSGHQILVGAVQGDGHRIFVIPGSTSPSEIAQVFQVGTHAEMSGDDGGGDIVNDVADILQAIHAICPYICTFADNAGFHADFTRKISIDDAAKIDSLFEATGYSMGCEAMMSDWEGDGPLFNQTMLNKHGLKLWWD